MGNVDWQDGLSDLSRRPVPDIYKPKALRLNPVDGDGVSSHLGNGYGPADDHQHTASEPAVDMRKLEVELGRRRLDEIADVVRALTYGEMMELAASMWNVKPDGSSLTEDNLPAVLYRWSTSRQS